MSRVGEIVILTGVCGAGKSTCLFAFEEMNYYCVENCPIPLVPNFLDLIQNGDERYQKVVIAVNASDAFDTIKLARDYKKLHVTTIFLDASKEELLSRYKLTRHVHPLQTQGLTLEGAISKEKQFLKKLHPSIDLFIDTTGLSVNNFRKVLFAHFYEHKGLTVNFISFGYKHGLPKDADLVFDMRNLPNPYYVDELKKLTGQDKKIIDYLFSFEATKILVTKIQDFLDYHLEQVQKEGRPYVAIGIGCSGGQHRSVAVADYLNEKYKERYMTIVNHRDLPKANR